MNHDERLAVLEVLTEERLAALEELTAVYGHTLDDLRNRVYALEHDTPQARRLQYEADVAMADAREYEDYR